MKDTAFQSPTPFTVILLYHCQHFITVPNYWHKTKIKLRGVYCAKERTIRTELPTLVGEVSENLLRIKGCQHVQRNGSQRPFLHFSRPGLLLSILVAPQLRSQGWVHPVPDPLHLRRTSSSEIRTRDLWTCIQELWPLDHGGCPTTGPLSLILVLVICNQCLQVTHRRGSAALTTRHPSIRKSWH
jgi:hypothetical protein